MVKSYNNSVFINCPFDDGFRDMLYAIIYTVYRCGFIPRSALEEDNALNNRLSKIENLIEECRFGIHDLSRTEMNISSLPRFNMPFEAGVFFGAKKFGNKQQKTKVALVLERQKYLYQQFISDLNGIDTKAHNNEPSKAIKIVRDWLQSSSGRKTIDGHLKIINEYKHFTQNVLPGLVQKAGMEINDLTFNDYCLTVESSLVPYMD
jgi:hypothetical protein